MNEEEIKEDISVHEIDLRDAIKKKEEIEFAISHLKRNQEEIRKQIDNHVAVLNGTIGVINYLNSKLKPRPVPNPRFVSDPGKRNA